MKWLKTSGMPGMKLLKIEKDGAFYISEAKRQFGSLAPKLVNCSVT